MGTLKRPESCVNLFTRTKKRLLTNNYSMSSSGGVGGVSSGTSAKKRRPLTGKQNVETAFIRNQIKSQSFRVRPSSARTSDPLRTTADTLYNSSRVFPSAGSIIVTKEHYPKTAGAAPQFGLTQSTKLLQQYKKKTLHTPKSKPNSSHQSTVSTASSKSETPKEKENVTRRQRRESRNRQRTDKSNIPLRSQSFRRNSEERKQGNLSFETAIQSASRSQSHHDLNPANHQSPAQTALNAQIIWKTPSIEHIDRLRRLNKSQEHLKNALTSTSSSGGGVAMRSPNQKRAPRPAALFDADRLSFSSAGEDDEDDDDDDVDGALCQSSGSSTNPAATTAPPPYQAVISSRRTMIPPSAQSSPNHFVRNSYQRTPRLRGRSSNGAMPIPDTVPLSDETSSSTPTTPQKNANLTSSNDIPFIDDSPVQMVQLRAKRTNRTPESGCGKGQREHRNSYISAVSNSKQSKYFASLDSIHDIVTPAPSATPPPPITVESGLAPLNRAGSIDSVLVDPVVPQLRPKKRADSVDRYPLSRASYIEATKTNERKSSDSGDRGRPHEKKPTLRRRPSLNKQLRKKLESMMSTTKIQFDVSTIERIRHYSSQKPLDAAILTVKIKNRGSWSESYVILHDNYLYIWKDEENMNNTLQVIAQTNAKFNSNQNDLSGLLFEVNLADCLCNVEYSSLKKHTFKITTKEKCDLFFACGSGDELMKWSKCISAISQSNLNVDLIKQLTDESKFNKKRVSLHHAQKSPNVHRVRKNRPTFSVKLELCPLLDDVPLVVVLCCTIIEDRLEVDGTGIYRRNGNKPIVDQLEEELNKNVEFFAQNPDCELMRDVKNVASVLKSFFRKLPEPLFTDALYDAFIETSTIKDDQTKIKRIRNLLIGLPQHHYSTGKYLMRHLNRVANSANTRMDSKNLATVIAPNLIRSTMATLISDVKDLNNQCSLIDLLISRYELFFEKSAEDISQSLPNIINAEDSLTPNTQPTDLTKLFALNQSLDEAALKNKSFFASLKGWNEKSTSSSTASKENVSSTEFSALNRTNPVIRYENQGSPSKVHKSRKDRLEMNPSSKSKSSSGGSRRNTSGATSKFDDSFEQ